jgi:hypothetical protein
MWGCGLSVHRPSDRGGGLSERRMNLNLLNRQVPNVRQTAAFFEQIFSFHSPEMKGHARVAVLFDGE